MTNDAQIGESFPLTRRYLAGLPMGLGSHPTSLSKASLLRSALAGHDAAAIAPGVPSEIRSLIEEPPPGGFWIPAVHLITVVHAIIDAYYPTEEAILAWGAKRTAALADHTFYRALLRVSSPRVFFSMTAKVNSLLQRGTCFEMLRLGANEALARLAFPKNLHDKPSLLGTVAMCDRIVELTGGKPEGTKMTEIKSTHALFHCRWTFV